MALSKRDAVARAFGRRLAQAKTQARKAPKLADIQPRPLRKKVRY